MFPPTKPFSARVGPTGYIIQGGNVVNSASPALTGEVFLLFVCSAVRGLLLLPVPLAELTSLSVWVSVVRDGRLHPSAVPPGVQGLGQIPPGRAAGRQGTGLENNQKPF